MAITVQPTHMFPLLSDSGLPPIGWQRLHLLTLNLGGPATVVEKMVCDPNCAGKNCHFSFTYKEYVTSDTSGHQMCGGSSLSRNSLWYQLGILHREGNGTPLQYSCLENPMDKGTWKAAVHGVAEGWTLLRDFTFTFHFHALEKEMATHSSVLAWRIPGMGKPGVLPSVGSHRVRHDWSDLAAAAAAAAGILQFSSILIPSAWN